MKTDDIKKALYKEKPKAQLQEVRKDGIVYAALCAGQVVKFIVPLDEVGEVIWEQTMDAKLLIRYIIENVE